MVACLGAAWAQMNSINLFEQITLMGASLGEWAIILMILWEFFFLQYLC